MSTVVVRDLTMDIDARHVLHEVSLEVAPGQIAAIMGMSGSGKTTLLKCLAGLSRPTSGTIEVAGSTITGLTERELNPLREKIGMVFQYAALFDSLTVFDNVAFGPVHHGHPDKRALEELVTGLLSSVGLPDTQALFPAQLSGGMKKRVGLARALATKPSILFYDEPTSGLDPVIAGSIDDLIVETRDRHGVTSVVVSHDIESIFRIADMVFMLDEGRIVARGTPAEMKASDIPTVRRFLSRTGLSARAAGTEKRNDYGP